jgi:hypothetical protein
VGWWCLGGVGADPRSRGRPWRMQYLFAHEGRGLYHSIRLVNGHSSDIGQVPDPESRILRSPSCEDPHPKICNMCRIRVWVTNTKHTNLLGLGLGLGLGVPVVPAPSSAAHLILVRALSQTDDTDRVLELRATPAHTYTCVYLLVVGHGLQFRAWTGAVSCCFLEGRLNGFLNSPCSPDVNSDEI